MPLKLACVYAAFTLALTLSTMRVYVLADVACHHNIYALTLKCSHVCVFRCEVCVCAIMCPHKSLTHILASISYVLVLPGACGTCSLDDTHTHTRLVVHSYLRSFPAGCCDDVGSIFVVVVVVCCRVRTNTHTNMLMYIYDVMANTCRLLDCTPDMAVGERRLRHAQPGRPASGQAQSLPCVPAAGRLASTSILSARRI